MPVTYDLSGKTAVVTGGAKGIGRAIVERLVGSGAQVHVWDLNPIDLNTVTFTKVDVTQREQIAGAIEKLIGGGSRVDILVNNAGYLGTLHPFDDHEPADWHRIIQVNLIGMMEVTQMVLPHMRRWGGGRIVNVGSLAGKEGLAKLAAYSAASTGVISFTKALGREIADTNIRVNCVAPGPIDTDMIRGLGPDAVDAMINDSPMKRLGLAEEVAHMVCLALLGCEQFQHGRGVRHVGRASAILTACCPASILKTLPPTRRLEDSLADKPDAITEMGPVDPHTPSVCFSVQSG
jgi:2-dehydro-3-deoxy-L-rhamnonate dehydrogenase (NAD+)